MWRLRRRGGVHQTRLAQPRIDHETMRHELDDLIAVCQIAGVAVESAAADAIRDVPPSLLAATRSRRGGEPLLLRAAGGRKAIAVIAGDGDPARWWQAIRDRTTLP
jgi:hypothetical protein